MKGKAISLFIRLLVCSGLVALGCGGSGPAKSTGTAVGGHPTAKTKGDISDLLTGYSQTVLFYSFTGYGPRLLTHGDTLLDPTLGLWYKIQLGSSLLTEKLYQDQARTIPAGTLQYLTNDAAQTLGGNIAVTLGKYAGLVGVYLQSLQSVGQTGTLGFSVPNVGTTDFQFNFESNNMGGYFGKMTNGVELLDGYLQTELVTNAVDGSITTSTTDSNGYVSSFTWSSTFIGTGTISGKDPGLPATIDWTAEGTGLITFADKSTASVTDWVVGK